MNIFLSTLNQTAFLFTLIIVGFVLAKLRVIPENSAAVLAKLENTVFIPALILGNFIENFTVERISGAKTLLLVSVILTVLMAVVAVIISKCMTRDRYIQKIYTYGLAFSNFGFMGNAVVSALFPEIFFEYLLFVLPLWVLIYLWGVPVLLIPESGEKQSLLQKCKAFVNPMFVSMFIGMLLGLIGLKLPSFFTSVISTAGDCMSPVAMLLTGITVSSISLKRTFSDLRTYIVSLIRLVVIPLAFIGAARFLPLSETVFTCALCSLAMPLGLNTIVVPSAYGKDTTVAAGMAVISHLLSCITIPLLFLFV